MSRIAFATTKGSSWNVTDGALRVAADIEEPDGTKRAETIYFTVPDGFHAHPDLVATALATLCGKKYKVVSFDFAGSTGAQQAIEATYGIKLEFKGALHPPRQGGDAILLNFSGGFDSMAAQALTVGKPIQLLSMDFGGAFAREEAYFRDFDTVICRTDLRHKGFHRNDWRFMAVGSLLMADMLKLGTIGFGSILEASPWNFRRSYGGKPPDDNLFGALDLQQTSWVRGLTEFGTAMVMLASKPEAIAPSLASLAAQGTEKFLRKQLLVEVAAEVLGLPVPATGERVPPREPVAYGTAFAIDFLALYFVKRLGRDYVSTFITDIPDDAETNEILTANLDFYLKYNPGFIEHIPLSMRNHVLGRMHEAGVYPYNETDFQSFVRVRQYLGQRHTIAP